MRGIAFKRVDTSDPMLAAAELPNRVLDVRV